MIRQAGVRYAVYGHVHGEAADATFEGERVGVIYRCVSVDRTGFEPALILQHPAR
jgi:predicted phosphohydrolase